MASSLPQNTQELLQKITDPFGVYCVLEVELKEGSSVFHVFPVMPESLVVTQRYLQTVTPTQGGVFVDEYGRAPSPVVLQGTFGRSPRPAIALGQNSVLSGFTGVNGARPTLSDYATTGYKLMKLLGEMVELSHIPDPTTKRLPTARFYNFAFGASYEVTLDSFEATMSVQRNGLWVYRLQMTMIRRLNGLIDADQGFSWEGYRRRTDALSVYTNRCVNIVGDLPENPEPAALQQLYRATDKVTAAKKRLSLQTMFDSIQKGQRFVDKVNAYATGFSARDINAFVTSRLDTLLKLTPGTTGDFLNTVRRLPQTMAAVRNIVYQVGSRLPSDVLRDIRTLERGVAEIGSALTPVLKLDSQPAPSFVDTYVSSFTPTASAIPRVEAGVSDLLDAVRVAEEGLDAMNTLASLYGYTGGAAPAGSIGAESVSIVFDTPPAAPRGGDSQTYIIRQGDTLSRIALEFYRNENEWPRIAQANETLFGTSPTLGGELAPTDLLDNYIGKVLAIPSTDQVTVSFVPYVFDDPRGVRAFGTDLPESMDTYLRPDGTTDLKVLSELETLLQGLHHRVAMPKGAIQDDPSFGSQVPSLIGQTFGALDDSMNAAKIEEALQQDGRLTAVTRVVADRDQDTMRIAFDAVARNAGNLGTLNLTVSRQSP